MASALQNRIIGTLIVFALAVIILPDLLSGKNYVPEEDFQVSPLRPASESEIQYPDFPSDFRERSERNAIVIDEDSFQVQEPQEASVASESNSAPETASDSSPQELSEGWVIQLGAFRNAERVAEIVTELRGAGYPAYSRKALNSSGDTLTLLMVGPDVDADKLQRQLAELQQLSGLSGRVVEYRPAEQ